uniref:Tyrosine-protein kinase SPK-1 n=1 Tax=Girardia tigrina TaxID=6162 RepID=SPK1_GIRTI|nr:RecName: Full=Tyrosine-protein kinase SPK-1 [Girardia tigrina]CAA53058.1 spk-1 protein [Girardia tigrina]
MGQKFSIKCKKQSKNKNTSKCQKIPKKAYEGPPGSYMVKAKYKYAASGDTDISFEEKEIMYVLEQFDEFWLKVVKQKDNKEGLVPSNYVSKQDGSPQSVEAWREIQRWEAEKSLMKIGLQKGTYIIRPSRKENSYALSVRDFDEKKKICIVKHFQIKTLQDEKGISYSVNIRNFPNILTLIQFYEKNGIGNTHIPLTDPMPDNYQPPVHFQDIEINRENIEILNEIGRGFFGSVHRAKWGRSYEVAAKMLQSSKAEREKFVLEAKIMHKLRHRKIVELLGVCTEPQDMPMLIIVEYMKNGSLKEYLKTPDGKKTNLNQMVHMMAEISEGMAYLESEKVVHRDLRADNILVANDLTRKVADFGLTELTDGSLGDQEKKTLRFPYKWTAPEAAKSKVFTSKSDVWSYGIVMFEILTWASSPYPDIPAKEVIEKVSKGYRMPNPEKFITGVCCPDEIYKIMIWCWDANPEKRPTFLVLQEKMDLLIVDTLTNNAYYSHSK